MKQTLTRRFSTLTGLFCLVSTLAPAQLRLTEIAPVNFTLPDEDGDYPDWLELYNAGTQPVQTQHFFLSDHAGTSNAWRLPVWTLQAGERRLVFASGKNRAAIPQNNWHTDFKLKKGETLWLRNESGGLIDSASIAGLQPGHVQARIPETASIWCLSNQPTPGMSNASMPCFPGYVADPVFTLPAGFYPSAQKVALFCSTPGAAIHYNLFGSTPTASDPVFNPGYQINLNTGVRAVRARAFAPGYLPSAVVTQTYAVGESSSLPVVFLSTDPGNLFDFFTGIYELGPGYDPSFPFYGANFWQDWERPATIEYFPNTHTQGFTRDVGIAIHGNTMKACDQKSFDLRAKDRYGNDEFDYPMFASKPWIHRFDKFVLRNAGNDNSYAHLRDGIVQTLGAHTNADFIANDLAVLFINGAYWGLYQLYEAHDEYFPQNNHAVDKDNVDIIRVFDGDSNAQTGTLDDWTTFMAFVQTHPLAIPANFDTLQTRYLDPGNFTDYIFTGVYCGNADWIPNDNNIKAWHRRKPYSPWRYILWDNDISFGQGTYDLLGSLTDSHIENEHENLFVRLLENPDFRRFFINRSCDLLNTVFLPLAVQSVRDSIANRMAPEMPRHLARWPNACYFSPGPTTFDDWYNRAYGEINASAEQRPQQLRQQYISHFKLDKAVTITLQVDPPGAGTIRISTITPEKYPWSGTYFSGNPVQVTAIPAPGYSFHNWTPGPFITNASEAQFTADVKNSGVFTAHFSGASASPEANATDPDRIEVFPNPSGGVFQVKASGIRVQHWQVFDGLGRILRSGSPESDQGFWQIDLADWPSGVYRLQIRTASGVQYITLLRW